MKLKVVNIEKLNCLIIDNNNFIMHYFIIENSITFFLTSCITFLTGPRAALGQSVPLPFKLVSLQSPTVSGKW